MRVFIYGLVFLASGLLVAQEGARLKIVEDKVQAARENYFSGQPELGITKHTLTTPIDIWSGTCYQIPLKDCKAPRDAWEQYTGLALPPESTSSMTGSDTTGSTDTGTSNTAPATTTNQGGFNVPVQ